MFGLSAPPEDVTGVSFATPDARMDSDHSRGVPVSTDGIVGGGCPVVISYQEYDNGWIKGGGGQWQSLLVCGVVFCLGLRPGDVMPAYNLHCAGWNFELLLFFRPRQCQSQAESQSLLGAVHLLYENSE